MTHVGSGLLIYSMIALDDPAQLLDEVLRNLDWSASETDERESHAQLRSLLFFPLAVIS
jgi:hypothetical protein